MTNINLLARMAAMLTFGLASFAACAEPALTVFGIAIGQPVTMPECPHVGLSVQALPTGPCYHLNDGKTGPITAAAQGAEILFAPGNLPALSRGSSVGAMLLDEKIEMLTIWTSGNEHKDADLQSLTEKFGRPQSLENVPWQNGYGAHFESVEAVWTLTGGAKVYYGSADSDLDHGSVSVRSKIGDEHMQDEYHRLTSDAGNTKL
ncbi:hypothetical protein [Paraburkholderia aspalathi]|nr:hypothetical protein [Paraburkholderia aspalathi]